MKETIYTIPLTEALDANADCLFCYLEDKLEREQVTYALGPAMMEPDYRILSNEKGFCRRHIEKMARAQKALPLALILDTHAEEVLKMLKDACPVDEKKGLFSKRAAEKNRLSHVASTLSSTCLVCERIDSTMEKFYHTFWYLYGKEPDFRKRVLLGRGFCLHHFAGILATSNHAGGKKATYVKELYELELQALQQVKEDVHAFTKQFDYRSNKEDWQGKADAHLIAAKKLCGSFERD